MAFIELPRDGDVDEETEARFEADRERLGFVANSSRAFAVRPAVDAARRGLLAALARSLGARRYELATMAAARRLRSSYCMLAHGTVLADGIVDRATVRALALDHGSAGLDAAEVAIMDFAERIAGDATSVTQADVDRLRGHGLSDGEIFDVAAAAAIRCFVSKTLDALGVEADAAYAELDEELREVLVVGRPIEAT